MNKKFSIKSPVISVIMTYIILLAAGCGTALPHYGLSQENYNYIVNESKEGGALDFAGKLEKGTMYPFNNKLYNGHEMSLIMWAQAVKKIGLKNKPDIISLYEEIKGVHLNNNEKMALITGFSF